MKHIHSYDSFINEAAKPKIPVDSSIWGDKKKMIEDKNSFKFFSNIVTPSYNNRGWSNSCVIVIEEFKGSYLIKMGYGEVKSDGDMKLHATVTAPATFTAEEIKQDPMIVAKKAVITWGGNLKKSLDMNFAPNNEPAIFKVDNDIDKPIAELVEFANKYIK